MVGVDEVFVYLFCPYLEGGDDLGQKVCDFTPLGGGGILYVNAPEDRAPDLLSLAAQATHPPTISPDSLERA